MLFNSFAFAVFLPIVFILYWALPHRFRWLLLLVSSYYFYMSWNPKYIFLILGTTIVSYLAAILIESTQKQRMKKLYLSFAVVICIGVLFLFKYFNFFADSFCSVLNAFSINVHPITLKLLLPVGISFYTFQTMSYAIDVYRGNVKAEKHFGYYATFISFFPQLVAGPIERTNNLLPQIKGKHIFNYQKASDGLKLMLWGYYKKLVIADTLAIYVDKVYNQLDNYNGFALVIAAFFFTLQIYCDFSGYSDIAIGTAKLLGIDLMKNFDSPYFSKTIKEFWSRWHISLSTWFRDYVYIPLGGNRCSKVRHNLNLLVTFTVSGLWHGANWTYIIWGCAHGLAQAFENLFTAPLKKLRKNKFGCFLSWILVFIFCNIAWVFFRAESISDAVYVFKNMFVGIVSPIAYLQDGFNNLDISVTKLTYLSVIIIILMIVDLVSLVNDMVEVINSKNIAVRWFAYIVIALLTIFFSQKGVAAEFVYFQF